MAKATPRLDLESALEQKTPTLKKRMIETLLLKIVTLDSKIETLFLKIEMLFLVVETLFVMRIQRLYQQLLTLSKKKE